MKYIDLISALIYYILLLVNEVQIGYEYEFTIVAISIIIILVVIDLYFSKNPNIKIKMKLVRRQVFMIILAIDFNESNENLMVMNKI